MKQCSKCKEWKNEDEFYKQNDTKDKLRSQCKKCVSAYKTSKQGRVTNKRYYQTKKGKESRRRVDRKRDKTEKRKQQRIETSNRYTQKYPEKYKARVAVKAAKNRGELISASLLLCKHCRNQAFSYHHHKGYDTKYQLDVIPLCIDCHRVADKEMSQ